MIDYSPNFGAFVEFAILNVTGSEFLLILMLLIGLAVLAAVSFRIPFEFTLAILYSPLLVATAYNSEFLKMLLLGIFFFAVIFMKYLTFNK